MLEHTIDPAKLPSQDDIWKLTTNLFPLCRSITGRGVRQTLSLLQEHIPIVTYEVPSGTQAFDWEVPLEWNPRAASIRDSSGNCILDFRDNNLHLVGYSVPFRGKLHYNELQDHLYTLPQQPDAIPYVTSYYQQRWGFCMTHNQKERLDKNGMYDVIVDTTLEPGALTYGEYIIHGVVAEEILISTYICHPSMANNELSGPVVATFLAKMLSAQKPHYTWRFVFVPETIGSIVYLAQNLDTLKNRVVGGYVVTCCGDPGPFSYLQTRQEATVTDRITLHLLKAARQPFKLYSFLERGSDERQYCAPGVDLPIGSLMRSKYGTYPEYHTSLDNLSFISPKALQESLHFYYNCVAALEANRAYCSVNLCEPQLGKRGLYPTLSTRESGLQTRRMMDLLAYCDGQRDLLSIAEKIGCELFELVPIAKILKKHRLIESKD